MLNRYRITKQQCRSSDRRHLRLSSRPLRYPLPRLSGILQQQQSNRPDVRPRTKQNEKPTQNRKEQVPIELYRDGLG
jgi:hypothetical protein